MIVLLLVMSLLTSSLGSWRDGYATFYSWQDFGVGDYGSWHISRNHRHPFACGGWYYRKSLGVANLLLPCGTKVALRNPLNGLTIVVPIVDRGPFTKGLTFDMTTETCLRIKHCWTGPIEWRIVR